MCAAIMLRRLLACLALLTGLAAAGAPAQAEVVGALATRLEASAAAHPAPQRAQAEVRDNRCARLREAPRSSLECEPQLAVRPLTVELGSDRARE
jgi:hypothetical protein